MQRLNHRYCWLLGLILLTWLSACDVVSVPVQSPGGITATSTLNTSPATNLPTPITATSSESATELLRQALHARELGDYDAAALSLRTLLDMYPHAPEARSASFYLAESFALRGRWTSAVEALRSFVANGPQPGAGNAEIDDLYARALFITARGYEEAGAWADAVATYERYRALKTPLEPYAHLREAAQQQALGQRAEAAASYEAAASTDIARGERAGAYEKAITLRLQLGQNDVALALYRKLLDFANAPEYRARILSEAATLAAQAGAPEDARTWLGEIVAQYPATAQALDAVAQLSADSASTLNPAQAARVYTAHAQWAQALPLYDTAIANASGDAALDLQRLRALAQRELGDFAAALGGLAAVGAAAPNSEPGRQAQLDWIQTTGQSGDLSGAIQGYREFAQAYAADPRAPEALARAAILLNRQGDSDGAIQQQLDLANRYPDSAQGHDALYDAAWALFRQNRMDAARAAWDTLRQRTTGIVAAQAAFWAARANATQTAEDQQLLAVTIAAAPDSYYAARAAELLDQKPKGSEVIGAPISYDHWRAAENWIATWSGQSAYYVSEQGYPTEVAQAGWVQRGIALQDVGLQSEAIAEWNAARAAWQADPIKLYLLARLAYDHNVPYIALKAAEDLTYLSPDKGFAHAPTALRQLIFPTPYSDLVLAQAQQYGLDALALYGMFRQESLFNPGARSGAGAMGMAQVMPATGQGIAQSLKVADFQEQDLLRPAVGIRFGTFYLSQQTTNMQGSLAGGLAAYNAGLGNAQRWANGNHVSDQDLFIEDMDFAETRSYVKLAYGYYGAYQRLYAAP